MRRVNFSQPFPKELASMRRFPLRALPSPPPAPPPAPPAPPATPPATAGNLELDVEVPFWTQGDVFVALDQPLNGKAAWTPDAVKLTKDAKGRYRATLAFAAGTTVNY